MTLTTQSRSFLVGVISLVIVGGIFVAVHSSSCFQVLAYSCTQQTPSTQVSTPDLAPGYKVYSPQTLAAAQKNGKVVLYFWAPWCSSCTSLDLELQDKKATIPEGITVLRIDYDKARELKKRYNIVTQHTFVQIDQQGNELSTWVGGDIENFAKFLK